MNKLCIILALLLVSCPAFAGTLVYFDKWQGIASIPSDVITGAITSAGIWESTVRTAAPGTPAEKIYYLADNDNWDPATVDGTIPYWCLYDGTDYVAVIDIDGNWLLASIASGVTLPDAFCVSISDEDTDLTTGTSKRTFRMPYAMTLDSDGVRASVKTAPTGSTIIVDINEGGTSIMTTTKLSIDATEKTSTTAATAPVITDTGLADDAEMTIDIDQIGSTVAGAGAKICFRGLRSW